MIQRDVLRMWIDSRYQVKNLERKIYEKNQQILKDD